MCKGAQNKKYSHILLIPGPLLFCLFLWISLILLIPFLPSSLFPSHPSHSLCPPLTRAHTLLPLPPSPLSQAAPTFWQQLSCRTAQFPLLRRTSFCKTFLCRLYWYRMETHHESLNLSNVESRWPAPGFTRRSGFTVTSICGHLRNCSCPFTVHRVRHLTLLGLRGAARIPGCPVLMDSLGVLSIKSTQLPHSPWSGRHSSNEAFYIFFKKLIYLFIFGCVGCSLLCVGFL